MMLPAMLRIEHTKLYGRRLLWVALGLVGLLTLLMFAGPYAMCLAWPTGDAAAIARLLAWPESLPFALNLSTSQSLGGLLIIVLTSVTMAQEYTWQTYSLWLRQGVARPIVLLAKVLALLGAAALIVLTPLVVGGVVSAAITPSLTGTPGLGPVNVGDVALSALRTAYALLPYLGLACLISVWTRSLVASLGLGLGYALLVEGVFTQLLAMAGGGVARIAMYLPGQMAAALANANTQVLTMAASAQEAEQAAAILRPYVAPDTAAVGVALYTLLFLGLAVWVFRRQDLTA